MNNLKPWVVCFSAALFFFYEFIQMNMFNVISPNLMATFHVTAESLGSLSAYCFYATVIFLIPAGLLLDRFSTRKIILTALSICVLGTFLFATTHSFALAHVFRFMTGIGSAFCFLSSVRLASRWFPSDRLALVIGLIVMMAMTGGLVSQKTINWLNETLGWRDALLILGTTGIVIIILNWLFVQDYPHDNHEEKADWTELGYWQSMRLSYSNVQNWMAGIYTSLMNMPIVILGSLWGSIYLQQTYHYSPSEAATLTSLLFLGALIGAPLAGWLSDYIGYRRRPMVLGALLSLLTTLILLFTPNLSTFDFKWIFFALGFISSAQVISYPTVAESNPKALTATAVSVISLSTQVGFAVFQPLFGWFLDRFWNGTRFHDVPIYPPAAYHHALLILPFSFTIAIILGLMMKETHCRRTES